MTATLDETPSTLSYYRDQLQTAENTIEILQESFADLAAHEDAEWVRLGGIGTEDEFDRPALDRISANCRVMAVASPLIKRGLQVRSGYIWGQGVQVAARDSEVNKVISAFWNDPSNKASLTASHSQEENERALGTDGNVFLACFTDPVTGRVQVRTTPFSEIRDVIHNPEDRDDPWFYLRQYTATITEQGYIGQRTRKETRRVLHPALGYRPPTRHKYIDGIEVNWNAPILHIPVNRIDGWKFGVPDVYAALPWARAYEGFLTDWAKLVKSLSRFAWRVSADRPSKANKAARAIQASPDGIGDAATMGPGASLEAIPKTGATVDSDSGRPLASMVAAALGLPVTMLLADPGQSGARAVAETLDTPTQLEMGQRRSLWASVFERITSHVVDASIRAPRGELSGSIERVNKTTERTRLPGEMERSVTIDWPDLDSEAIRDLVWSIVAADGTGKIPPKEIARLLLSALGVRDVDEIIDEMTDEEGNFIEPEVTAADAAVRAYNRGQDPASAVR